MLQDDPETIEVIQGALSSESLKCQFKIVQDRVAAQLLLRRARFDIIVVSIDGPEEEQLYNVLRTQVAAEIRFVGIATVSEESELMRLDSIGLDGIIERPVSKEAIIDTIKMLSQARFLSMVS